MEKTENQSKTEASVESADASVEKAVLQSRTPVLRVL